MEDGETDELGCEDDEGDDAGGPAEVEGCLEAAEDDGVEDTACVSDPSISLETIQEHRQLTEPKGRTYSDYHPQKSNPQQAPSWC